MSSHVSGGVETREGQNKLLPPHLGNTGAHPVPQRREGLIFAPPLSPPPTHMGAHPMFPPWVISHSPPPTHMGAHPMSPPWVISRSPPPLTWELIPCSLGGHESSSHVPPRLPHPLIGYMGAHPMFPIRERNTLCVPPPPKRGGRRGMSPCPSP